MAGAEGAAEVESDVGAGRIELVEGRCSILAFSIPSLARPTPKSCPPALISAAGLPTKVAPMPCAMPASRDAAPGEL